MRCMESFHRLIPYHLRPHESSLRQTEAAKRYLLNGEYGMGRFPKSKKLVRAPFGGPDIALAWDSWAQATIRMYGCWYPFYLHLLVMLLDCRRPRDLAIRWILLVS